MHELLDSYVCSREDAWLHKQSLTLRMDGWIVMRHRPPTKSKICPASRCGPNKRCPRDSLGVKIAVQASRGMQSFAIFSCQTLYQLSHEKSTRLISFQLSVRVSSSPSVCTPVLCHLTGVETITGPRPAINATLIMRRRFWFLWCFCSRLHCFTAAYQIKGSRQRFRH